MTSNERYTIELLAYFIYVDEGQPKGCDWQHWLEAEKLVEIEKMFEAECRLESYILTQDR